MAPTSLPHLGMTFLMAASVMIAIPSGVQAFCWIVFLWGAKINLKTPMLFRLVF